MESILGIEDAGASGVGAREFDDGLDAFAARAGKERFCQSPAGFLAQSLGQLPGEARNVRLKHGRAELIELSLQRGDEARMIVTDIVDAIAGIKVDDPPPFDGFEFGSFAADIFDVHSHYVEQSRPLRIDVALILPDAALNHFQHHPLQCLLHGSPSSSAFTYLLSLGNAFYPFAFVAITTKPMTP